MCVAFARAPSIRLTTIPTRRRELVVIVDPRTVSPKNLISRATKLPVNTETATSSAILRKTVLHRRSNPRSNPRSNQDCGEMGHTVDGCQYLVKDKEGGEMENDGGFGGESCGAGWKQTWSRRIILRKTLLEQATGDKKSTKLSQLRPPIPF
jgi:hypothetical protein